MTVSLVLFLQYFEKKCPDQVQLPVFHWKRFYEVQMYVICMFTWLLCVIANGPEGSVFLCCSSVSTIYGVHTNL